MRWQRLRQQPSAARRRRRPQTSAQRRRRRRKPPLTPSLTPVRLLLPDHIPLWAGRLARHGARVQGLGFGPCKPVLLAGRGTSAPRKRWVTRPVLGLPGMKIQSWSTSGIEFDLCSTTRMMRRALMMQCKTGEASVSTPEWTASRPWLSRNSSLSGSRRQGHQRGGRRRRCGRRRRRSRRHLLRRHQGVLCFIP